MVQAIPLDASWHWKQNMDSGVETACGVAFMGIVRRLVMLVVLAVATVAARQTRREYPARTPCQAQLPEFRMFFSFFVSRFVCLPVRVDLNGLISPLRGWSVGWKSHLLRLFGRD
jgi:hypothetical protein